MIHVVVGLLLNKKNDVLVAQREPQKFQGGRWEFPGGKVESGESAFDALKRELQEEIGVDVVAAEPFMQLQHEYPDRVILLDIWLVNQFNQEPLGKEGQDVKWVSHEALNQLSIPDANIPIIQKLFQDGIFVR